MLAGSCGCLAVAGCGGASGAGPNTTFVNPPTRTYSIPSSAMEPTLNCAKPAAGCLGTADDRVVVRPGQLPKRGDIVVFRAPRTAAEKCGEGGTFVKRLIGLPGETVHEERHGFIDIDGKRLHEPYLTPTRRAADVMFFGKTWYVPAGHYFMLGDNRAESCDSRVWGSVPAADVIGPVTKIIRTR